jgi:UDP-glucose 4-epimerase
MIQNVLITGIHGLIGRHLASILVEEGFSIHGIARGNSHDTRSSVHHLTIDLASEWSFESLPEECDVVIHLAQSASFRDFPNSALDVFKVNIESTARLLDYARQAGVKKFVYASSGGVYGNGSHAFRENEPIVPPGQLGYYLGSKACGEILVQSYATVFDVVVVRPFFVYGSGQTRSMLIPRLYDSVANCRPITLQGESGIRINPIHVEDAATAIAAALNLDRSATFNIAGPDVRSIREICEGMGHHLGIRPVFAQLKGEPTDLIGDIAAMRRYLHEPVRQLEEAYHDVKF